MADPADPLRPSRVDPDAMFAALDRVVSETPIGIPQPPAAPAPAGVPANEIADILFPAHEATFETAVEPVGHAESFAQPMAWSEPAVEAAARPAAIVQPVVRREPGVETAARLEPAARVHEPSATEPGDIPRRSSQSAAGPGGADPTIVLPRDDRPWSAWQERRRSAQPEPVPDPPRPRPRTISPAPALAPEPPPAFVPPPPSHTGPSTLFGSVSDVSDEPAPAAPSASSLRMIWAAIIVLAAVVVGEALYIAASRGSASGAAPIAAPSSVGTVYVETTPPGASVLLNGQDRGATPATLLLAAGDYQLEIVRDGQRQPLPIKVKAGAEIVYRVMLQQSQPSGGVSVSSEPAGVPVAIDGTRRGITPLTVSDLPPGEHTVTVLAPSGSIRNKVVVLAGSVASMAVMLPSATAAAAKPAGDAVGYLSVDAPIEVNLVEGDRVVGTSGVDRILLPAGRHEIETVSESLGYSSTHAVVVNPGSVTRLRLDLPPAKVSLNAIPWADVSIDGKSVGQTPIGNLSVPIGTHEVVFRHPQFGEQRQTITVTVSGPNRFSATMKR